MATRSILRLVLRLAGATLAAGVLAGFVLLPPAPLQASISAAQAFAEPSSGPLTSLAPLSLRVGQTEPIPSSVRAGLTGPALSSPAGDPGVIAYADRKNGDIHVIAPDGSQDRVIWTRPHDSLDWMPFDIAWRPDGRELAFSSAHEATCSWFESDIYAIRPDGSGYRRITNAPACAVLATLPKGKVSVSVYNSVSEQGVQVYVMGSQTLMGIAGSGTVLFDEVADLGPGVMQPTVGVYGLYRIMPGAPYFVDVQAGKTVSGASVYIYDGSGLRGFGTGEISWLADGSWLGFNMRGFSIYAISATPKYAMSGGSLPTVEDGLIYVMAWNPDPAHGLEYLYASKDTYIREEKEGIYLGTTSDKSGGTLMVPLRTEEHDGVAVYEIEWLPNASGFLYTVYYAGLGIWEDIFRYDFATKQITKLTNVEDGEAAVEPSISPDGKQMVFELTDQQDTRGSVWIMNLDGSGLRKLVDNAGCPAWGRTAAPVQYKRTYLPVILRG